MVETGSVWGEEEPTGGTANRHATASAVTVTVTVPLRRGEREEREGEDIFGEGEH
jgi:hypothetical protein